MEELKIEKLKNSPLEDGYYEANADLSEYFVLFEDINNHCVPHYHNSIEILFVRSGEHKVWINGEENLLQAGDLCISNSFDLHSYRYKEHSETSIILIGQELLARFARAYPNKVFPNILRKTGDSDKDILRIISLLRDYQSYNFQTIYGLINAFWGVLLHYYPLHDIEKHNNNTILQVLNYIENNYKEPLAIEIVAEEFSYNPVYFSRLFNKCTGMHFRDYLNRVRLRKMDLLKERHPDIGITKLALDCGFDSLSTYYRTVKKENNKNH